MGQLASTGMGDDGSVSLDLSNYELRWPTPLFVSEGERLLRSSNRLWEEQAVWLLTEALAGTTAVADFEELPNRSTFSDDPLASTTPGWEEQDGMDRRNWLTKLADEADQPRLRAAPRRRPATVLATAARPWSLARWQHLTRHPA